MSSMVRENVLYHRAAATALFLDNVVTPQLQPLADNPTLPAAQRAILDGLMGQSGMAERVPFFDVWLADGTIVYSRSGALTGQRFDLPRGARLAFRGEMAVMQADMSASEHINRQTELWTEIYSPVRSFANSEIIAVAEFHESPNLISRTLLNVTLRSWLWVGLACLAIAGALSLLIFSASRTIKRQQRSLEDQLNDSRDHADRFKTLQVQAEQASRLSIEMHDNLLRNVGQDLHDGPLQLIGYSAIKVERARRSRDEAARLSELADIEQNLQRAMNEVRDIAVGLVLPDIETLSLEETLTEAVASHKRRTGVTVNVLSNLGDIGSSTEVKACVYRFAQEGLNNAFRHGAPGEVGLRAFMHGVVLRIEMTNQSLTTDAVLSAHKGLGIRGLRARIESLDGALELILGGEVTKLAMQLNLSGRHVRG
jgi:signal transduction histidine kinase